MKTVHWQSGFLAGLLLSISIHSVFGAPADPTFAPLPAGEYVFQVNTQRLQTLHLRLPAGDVLYYTEKGDPEDTGWKIQLKAIPEEPTLWCLQATQITKAVRREVVYWLFVPAATESDIGPMEPLFVTEKAFDRDNEATLYLRQSLEWTLRFGTTVNPVVLPRAASWVLQHLPLVYDMDILETCSDFFWHNPDNDEQDDGFNKCIACTNRCIALDPQAEDLYTLNAWLLWSDWVAWKQDHSHLANGQENLTKAIALIQKGRAANPDSAAYHLDAANTLLPLAQHHQPELMDLVIRYYHHAEALATEKDMRIVICKCLGHRYRIKGNKAEAIRWYQAVLELDPENKVAVRFLKDLTTPEPEQ